MFAASPPFYTLPIICKRKCLSAAVPTKTRCLIISRYSLILVKLLRLIAGSTENTFSDDLYRIHDIKVNCARLTDKNVDENVFNSVLLAS